MLTILHLLRKPNLITILSSNGLQQNMYAQTLDSPIETEADGLPLSLWS